MARYTDPDVIRETLRQAYDVRQYGHYYALQCYALGAKYELYGGMGLPEVGELGDWPDIFPQFYNVGQSRQTLSNEMLMMMKVCYQEPDPQFPDLDPISETVRKAYILERWRGDRLHGEGHWASECHLAFMNGNGLGVGFVQVGVKNSRAHIQYHPTLNVIWDRHFWSPGRSRFIAFVHHLPVEMASAMFGSKVEKEATDTQSTHYDSNPIRRVKVIEYFDMGLDGKEEGKTTHAWFLNNLGGRVLDISENEYGCLPYAYYQHLHVPGMRRPIGRMDLQMATQESRNQVERYLRQILMRGSGLDIISADAANTEDVQRWLDGEVLPAIRIDSGTEQSVDALVKRLPPHEPPMGAFQYLQMLDRAQNTESGSSDADRANLSQVGRTLGEAQLRQQGADIQSAWSRKQYAEFLKQVISKATYIGSQFDTAPTMLDIDGKNVTFNDPANPQSLLSNWLSEPSRVVVNEDNLQYFDSQVDAQRKTALWMPFLNDPFTNPVELRKKIFKAMGEKDPAALLQMPQPSMPAPAGPPPAA